MQAHLLIVKKPFSLPAVFLLALLFASPSFAYEPMTGHAPLVQAAMDLYVQCKPNSQLYKSSKNRKRIERGDTAMDKSLGLNPLDYPSVKGESVFLYSKRVFNWHFYNPNKIHLAKYGRFNLSHENLWQSLQQGLQDNPETFDQLLFLGGLLHFVEDFTVPSHVVPVYHGPSAVKWVNDDFKALVTYLDPEEGSHNFFSIKAHAVKDSIDSIKVDKDYLLANLKARPELCDAVKTNFDESEGLDAVRLQTTIATLNLLKENVPQCPGFNWQFFWQRSKPNEYFGRYAHDNGVTLFGKAGQFTNQQGITCSFEENDSRYARFVAGLHQNAVIADMQVLSWFEQQI